MCAEDIYRTTLEELAKEGNERAALALKLGSKFTPTSEKVKDAFKQLNEAHAVLNTAITLNQAEWTGQTDRCCNAAQTFISNAKVLLA